MNSGTEHIWVEGCEDGCGYCNTCTLSICSVCGLAEGSLTTHCPGEDSYRDMHDKVYAGEKDYRYGEWVDNTLNRFMFWKVEDIIKSEQKYLTYLISLKVTNATAIKETREYIAKYKEILREQYKGQGY